jgi:cell division protein FtsQ
MKLFGKRRGKGLFGGRASLPPNRRRKSSAKRAGQHDGAGRRSGRARRIALAVIKLAAAGLVTAACLWGGFLAYRHATSAEYFAVSTIAVEGQGRLGQGEVLAAAGIEHGMNVFAVDVDEVAARLESQPWIAEAAATRQLPRTVQIEIVERKAEAMVLFGVPYLVDDSGEVFKRWSTGDPQPSPMLTGFTREQFALDGEEVRAGIRDAISLARRFRAAGIDRVAPLSEIHREVDGSFSMTIGDDPFYVRFGKGPFRKKLQRLAALLRQIKRDGERPAMVFFDNEVRPDRVTVKVKPRFESKSSGNVEVSKIDSQKNPPKI